MQRAVRSLVVVVCGCGSVMGDPAVAPDAAPPSDAAMPDAVQAGPLTIVTQTRLAVTGGAASGAAQSGVDVIALQPDGRTLSAMAQSDAVGHASLDVQLGGSVTAIYKHAADTGSDLVTYFAVAPGDTLTFGQRFAPSAQTTLGTTTFTYPAVAGVNVYQVFGPCGSALAQAGQQSVVLAERASCHHDPMDVVFVALDTAGRVLDYNHLSVEFQPGATRSIGSWLPPKTAMLTMTGLSADVLNVNAALLNVGNVEQTMYSFLVSGQATGGAYTNSFPWATTAVRTEAQLTMSRAGNFQPIQLLDLLPADATTWTVASPALPPWLQAFDANTVDRTGSITLVGDGEYTAAVFQLRWQHMVASAFVASSWTFVLPPHMTLFTFPVLPAAFAAALPQPEDSFVTEAHVIAIPAVHGYDAVRALPERSLICPDSLVPDCALRNAEFQRVIFE